MTMPQEADPLDGVALALAREGRVEVEVPSASAVRRRGPASREAPVFYNQATELGRDASVAVLRAVGREGWRALDGLAGSGVRGIRYAVEGPVGLEVTLNDADPLAAALCARNAARNGVAGARVTQRRLEPLLAEERFDLVDIDPFGSPARFLAGGVRAVRRGGILALTATDTPALCGSTPRPCVRRYGARPWRGEAMHEVALRILLGAVVREAARTDLVAEPVLSMAEDHYVRVFLRVGKGAQRADAVLRLVGYAWRDEDGGVATGPHAPGGPDPWAGPWAGPLWLGPLHDRAAVAALEPAEHMGTRVRLGRLRELWLEEADLPPLLVDVNALSGRLHLPTPKMADVIGRLRDQGFRAGRAHTNPQGIKTDAPMAELGGAIEGLSKRPG